MKILAFRNFRGKSCDFDRPSRESSRRIAHVAVCSAHVYAYTKGGSVPEICATGGIVGHRSTVSCSFEGAFDGRWRGQFRFVSKGMRLNGFRGIPCRRCRADRSPADGISRLREIRRVPPDCYHAPRLTAARGIFNCVAA